MSTTNRFINTGSTAVSYDEAGNITQDMKFRLSGSLGMKYAYDANGRQTSAKFSDNSNNQTSVYDCVGQRVQTTVGGTTRTMVYDIYGQDVADYSGSTLERENLYRGGQLLATYANSTWQYVLTDAQGSTRAVMSSGGSPAIVARHDYLPFGEELASNTGTRSGTQGYGPPIRIAKDTPSRNATTQRAWITPCFASTKISPVAGPVVIRSPEI
ncbi:MAG TPA: hypothetical protein VGN86_06425 [Pyrinomonadaceae bacterium]|nr:hypothetical protein [Pyrinomonadaceae bacterium]